MNDQPTVEEVIEVLLSGDKEAVRAMHDRIFTDKITKWSSENRSHGLMLDAVEFAERQLAHPTEYIGQPKPSVGLYLHASKTAVEGRPTVSDFFFTMALWFYKNPLAEEEVNKLLEEGLLP